MEEFHKEKSILCNRHLQEVKPLEKDWVVVGVLRERAEYALRDLQERHRKELEALEARYNIAAKERHEESPTQKPLHYYPDRDWNSLGKKELEVEAAKRGLPKHKSREELVTELILFQTAQAKKVADRLIDPQNIAPACLKKGAAVPTHPTLDKPQKQEQPSHAVAASGAAGKFLKKTGAADTSESSESSSSSEDEKTTKAAPSKAKRVDRSHSKKERSPSSSDSSSSSSSSESDTSSNDESSGSEENLDVPDSQKIMGSGRESSRAAHRRKHAAQHRGSRGKRGGQRGGGASRHVAETPTNDQSAADREEEEKTRARRERAVQTFLVKVLQANPSGVPMTKIVAELEKVKVRNFRPQLLGYETLEDWISAQPPHIARFDPVSQVILQGKRDEIPTSDESDTESAE